MVNMVIADDEPGIRDGLSNLFPWAELNVEIVYLAANGRAALNYIENHPVDLVLADIRMPVMDGLELSRVLNQSYPAICTILISAYTDFEYARKAMRYGVREYITKPVDYHAFISTLHRVLTEMSASLEKNTPSYQGYYEEIAQLVKRYIDENPASATLVGASERVGMSANYISRIFRHTFHKTFSDYLLESRMETALLLLKQGTSLDDAAWQAGYNSLRNFKQAFTKHFGQSPSILLKLDKREEKPDA